MAGRSLKVIGYRIVHLVAKLGVDPVGDGLPRATQLDIALGMLRLHGQDLPIGTPQPLRHDDRA